MAQSAVSLRIDTAEFRQAIRDIIRTDTKGWAYVLNDQGIRFCQEAIRQTKAADAGRIESTLGRKLVRVDEYTKGGKPRKRPKKIFGKWQDTFAARIINARRKAAGKDPVFGKELDVRADKMVRARKRSAGYIKAGWVPGIKALAAANKSGGGARGAKASPRRQGWAKPAKPSINPFALINNYVVDKTRFSARPGRAVAIGQAAAEKAIAARVVDMKNKLIERMNRDHAKFQRGVIRSFLR